MSKLRLSLVDLLWELGAYSGCHRMPERSFFYKGRQFPVCARCTGVCLGQFSAIAANIFFPVPLRLSVLLLSLMGIDWGLQEAGIHPSTNFRRFFTGILGGFGLFSCYGIILKKLWHSLKIKHPAAS